MYFKFQIKFEYIIIALYLLLGLLWILYSDNFVHAISSDPRVITEIQTYKGFGFVFVSALLFFFLIKAHLSKLRSAREKAKESDRMKSAFLANVSHEFRTPMNGILGFSELLKNSDISEKERDEYFNIIQKSSERLLLLIDDLITISKIESGQFKTVNSAFNINEMLAYIGSVFSPIAKEKGLGFSVELLNDDSPIICTDKEKLTSMFSYLIRNAIKFTDSGEISIGANIVKDGVEFFVKDTGIGIPKDKQDAIFSNFVRGDLSLSNPYQGIGLGLSLTKSIVNSVGGTIKVDSDSGKGSIFLIFIPKGYICDSL